LPKSYCWTSARFISNVDWATRNYKGCCMFGLSKKEKIKSARKKYFPIFSEYKEKLSALITVQQEDVLTKFLK
jgi:hypothetical protein